MVYTIREIAAAIGAEAFGDVDLAVGRLAEPADADPDDLALATNPRYAEALGKGRARAAMIWQGADWQDLGLSAAIVPPRPRFAMSALTRLMDPGQGLAAGIHETAIIDPTARLGRNVTIGPYAVVAADTEIGDNSVLGAFSHVGWQSHLGPDAVLREHASIGPRCRIGARFIAQPGARIGGDGFSYVTAEKSNVEEARETLGHQGDAAAQPWHRIHSLGGVEIGDDVEVGASSSIDAGTIRPTRIGNGTKIDSLVQIAHNVIIGRDCLVCACVGIAGSTVIGDNCVFAGQSGVADNLLIGDRVIATAGTKVLSNVPAGRMVMGYPATKMETQIESYKASRRLPRLLRDVAALKKAVFKADPSD